MRLAIREIHAPATVAAKGLLNEEWFIVENTGDRPFSTSGCSVLVSGGGGKGKLRIVGTLDPGFTLKPGERVRIVTGSPGKKAHGPAPEGEPRNYHLFLAEPLFRGKGGSVALAIKQHEVARATLDPEAPGGVAGTETGGPP
jgi:hypothetical protein